MRHNGASIYLAVVEVPGRGGHVPDTFVPFWNHGKAIATNRNKVDPLPQMKVRTLFLRCFKYERALKLARKVGTVRYCQKVDPTYQLNRSEHMKLNPRTFAILVEKGEYTVSRDLTVTKAKKQRIEIA